MCLSEPKRKNWFPLHNCMHDCIRMIGAVNLSCVLVKRLHCRAVKQNQFGFCIRWNDSLNLRFYVSRITTSLSWCKESARDGFLGNIFSPVPVCVENFTSPWEVLACWISFEYHRNLLRPNKNKYWFQLKYPTINIDYHLLKYDFCLTWSFLVMIMMV